MTESAFDFSKIVIEKVTVGEEELVGGCVLSIKPPVKGLPVWVIRYSLDGNLVRVLYATGIPVKIDAIEIAQEQKEEVIEDEE